MYGRQDIQDFTNDSGDEKTEFQRAFLEGRIGNVRLTLGRYHSFVADGNLYDHRVDGMKMALGKELKAELEYGKLAYADGAKLGDKFYRFTLSGKTGVYDFHSKYTKGETEYLVPAPLDKETTRHVQELAVATYKVLGCSGVARVDVMLDEAGKGYVLEANTVPGMTATSLVPKAAAAVGISFPDLCEKILLSASLNDK